MSQKTSEQKRARALQDETGWSYCECLRCVREMTQEQIDQLRCVREMERKKS